MPNIVLVIGQVVNEFESLRALLDWTILAMKGETKAQASAPKAEVKAEVGSPKESISEVASPQETAVKGEAKAPSTPNSHDLPPMRKPFFGGKDKADLLSFAYAINGETPRVRPADTCRVLFTKTEAFKAMSSKEQDKVINWGLSFLKKLVREDGKPHSIETRMLVPYGIDKFNFLAGASVRFTVSIKES